MNYRNITTERQLLEYCEELAHCRWIAFDTEFVSERTFRPVLCLIQVASEGQLAVIDAVTLGDLTPFWRVIASPGHETIVHAGRSEMEFCLESVGCWPADLFDVQLAAGLAGNEYPAGYGNLLSRLLGEKPHKHETRTDWLRRPLSERQIEYALDDARYLYPIREKLYAKLLELGRLGWLADEMLVWREDVQQERSGERWRRVSGSAGLDPHSLAIVRELWQWREAEAQRRDTPIRYVLRDDLIVELAKRRSADPKRIHAVRGLERGDLQRRVHELASAIQRALELPEDQLPQVVRGDRTPQLSVLGQFLFAALGSVCRQAHLAPNLVGTPNDIRELITYRTDGEPDAQKPPKLARGWRAEFVGRLFDDLLSGKTAIRIGDPRSEHPLVFE